MKVFVALILAVTLAVVYSDTCHQHSDCSTTVTMCGTGYTLKCVHDLCDCVKGSDANCATQADCASHDCHGHDAHCVDGTCHCRQQGGGGNGR